MNYPPETLEILDDGLRSSVSKEYADEIQKIAQELIRKRLKRYEEKTKEVVPEAA